MRVAVFIIIAFLLGGMANIVAQETLKASIDGPILNRLTNDFSGKCRVIEKDSPGNYVSEEQIHVYKDKIILDIENAEWTYFTDTNSMDPIIDYGANAIEVKPKSKNSVRAGDIVSYKSKYNDIMLIHRIIETNHDDFGWYAVLKGDNNPKPDPEKVRFEQITGKVIAIVY